MASKILIVGARGIGKSTFVSSITGIQPGFRTTSPIEWRITPSENWSARVSIAYYIPDISRSRELRIATTAPKPVGGLCASPVQLLSALKKAMILAYYPAFHPSLYRFLKEDAIEQALSRSSKPLSSAIIYVDISGLQRVGKGLTIVDLPGKASITRALSDSDPFAPLTTGIAGLGEDDNDPIAFSFVKQIIRCYTSAGTCELAVVLPISERQSDIVFRETEHARRSHVMSFVNLIQNNSLKITGGYQWPTTSPQSSHREISVIYNRLDKSPPFLLNEEHAHEVFYVHSIPEKGSFARSNQDLERVRQEESSFFLLSPHWKTMRNRKKLGVANLLKMWSLRSPHRPSKFSATWLPRLAFATKLIIFLSVLLFMWAKASNAIFT
ncbi:hypothetical protein CVT26_001266 [Gymnopilus dilepis]|uniref:Uncharacterized protein n=1 Tax=Gymnopilus dilepis TaxID=231916 RepID=A0A409WEG2_9AGAR|nr:hypothetical protein CVT26_001266 [Gymnopilus dilepis]